MARFPITSEPTPNPGKDILVPASWHLKLPAYNGSGSVIMWQQGLTEQGDAASDIRISANQQSAIYDEFYTTADWIQNREQFKTLSRTLIGGYSSSGKWVTPYEHPYRKGFFCRDIVGVTMASSQGDKIPGGTSSSPRDGSANYVKQGVACLKLSFETVPYEFDSGNPGSLLASDGNGNPTRLAPFSTRYMWSTRSPISERINTALGVIVYTNTDYPVQFGSWIIRPMSRIVFHCEYVLSTKMFPGGGPLGTSILDGFLGYVNNEDLQMSGSLGSTPAGGGISRPFPKETLLFDSYDVLDQVRDNVDLYTYHRVNLNMIFMPKGWNKLPTLTGNDYAPVSYFNAATGKHTPVFQAQSFNTLFNQLQGS